jgi:UDP-glucose 4-epimerase
MDLNGARVLVVGGAGFVGSHLVDQLLERSVASVVVLDNFVRGSRSNLAAASRDPRLTVTEGSITDPDLLADLMRGTDFVFHLAALWLFECVNEPRSAIDVNVGGTYNVVEAAKNAGVRKVVFSSSASVYGDAVTIPMTEEHPFNNRTMYGATKIAGEQFFRAVHEQFGLDYVGLRYMNVYGPRMDYRGAYVSVIMKILDRLDRGEAPVIFGDGSQAYDFIHVADVARANILALESSVTDECLNVGSGTRTTINELSRMLLDITGSRLEPTYLPQEQMFVKNRVGSIERAQQAMGFHAEIPLRAGLESVVQWRAHDQSRAPAPQTA